MRGSPLPQPGSHLETPYAYDTSRHPDPARYWRTPRLSVQRGMGLLPERRGGPAGDRPDRFASVRAALGYIDEIIDTARCSARDRRIDTAGVSVFHNSGNQRRG